MNQELIEMDVQLTLNDYLRVNYWFLFKKFKAMLFVLLIACVVYPLYVLIKAPLGAQNSDYWGFAIPWAMLVFLFVSTYLGAKRQFASNKSIHESHHYVFSNDGVQFVSPSSSGFHQWGNFREAIETKNNLLLFLALNQMLIFPKRCFQNDEQIRQFRELLLNHVPSKTKKN